MDQCQWGETLEELSGPLVHTNFPKDMDQWRSKFFESFSLDRYWSIERSSLQPRLYESSLNSLELRPLQR